LYSKTYIMAKLKMTKKTLHIILRGEGANQHVLHGDFKVETEERDFSTLVVTKNGKLRHEQPDGSFAEHKTLNVESGNWVMGKQVEYNPFKQEISAIWD